MTGPYANLPATASRTTPGPGIVNRPSTTTASCTCPSTPRSASTPDRCSRPSACWPASPGEGHRRGSFLEIAQSDAARPWTGCAARPGRPTSGPSPRSPATRPTTTSVSPGTAGMEGASATRSTRSSDGFVLFMASGRVLEELLPGRRSDGHVRAVARQHLRRPRPGQHRDAPRAGGDLRHPHHRRVGEWSGTVNTTIALVNTPRPWPMTPVLDRFGFMPHETHGADMIGTPLKFLDAELPDPTPAPTAVSTTTRCSAACSATTRKRIAALRGGRAGRGATEPGGGRNRAPLDRVRGMHHADRPERPADPPGPVAGHTPSASVERPAPRSGPRAVSAARAVRPALVGPARWPTRRRRVVPRGLRWRMQARWRHDRDVVAEG